MIDRKRHRFWLSLVGILGILIGVTVWLFVEQLSPLRSGDVLFYDEEKIWLLNPSDYSLSLMVDMARAGFTIGGDVHASPDHDHLYLTAQRSTGDPKDEPLLLLQYDLRGKDLQVILDTPGLSRMSPIFPGGKHAIVMIDSPDWPDPKAITTTCVLEFATGDCLPIGKDIPYIDINEELWLSEDTLVTSDYRDAHNIYVLSLDRGKFSLKQALTRPDLDFSTVEMDILSDHRVILAPYRSDGFQYIFLSLDLDSLEWADLPFVPTNYGARINDVSVSSDACYVGYGAGLNFEVKELCSGRTVAALYNVLHSSWIRDTDSIVMYVEHFDYPGDPDELVVLDASTGQTQTILTLDHQVWFETVP